MDHGGPTAPETQVTLSLLTRLSAFALMMATEDKEEEEEQQQDKGHQDNDENLQVPSQSL